MIRAGLLIVVIGSAVALLRSVALPPGADRSGGDSNVLHVPESALDFGVVLAESEFPWTVPVTNVSPETVVIESMYSSCGCTVVQTDRFSLPPGETRDVSMVLDLLRESRSTSSERAFSVNLFALTSSGSTNDQRFGWTLKGRVRDALEVSPAGIALDEVVVEDTARTGRLRVTSWVPLQRLVVESPAEWSATVEPGETSRERWVDVSLAMTAPSGLHHDHLTLVAETAEQGTIRVKVPVRCRVVEEIGIVPEQRHLGAIPVGAHRSDIRRLASRAGRPFRVVDVRIDDEDGVEGRAEIVDDVVKLTSKPLRVGLCSYQVVIDWEVAAEGESEWTLGTGTFPFACVGLSEQSIPATQALLTE